MDYAFIVTFALGLLSATLSRWLYDVGKEYGIFPSRPTLGHIAIAILCFAPFLLLMALPELLQPLLTTGNIQRAITVVAIAIWALLLVGTVYVVRAKTQSDIHRHSRRPRFRRRTQRATAVLLALFTFATAAWILLPLLLPPSDIVTILVADFEGPDPGNYRVTETIINRLREATSPYDDVEVLPLGRAITEAEGSVVARAEGAKRNSDLVIWGWYGTTAEIVLLVYNFETFGLPPELPDLLGPTAKGHLRTVPLAQLESVSLQINVSTEMAYLTLFSLGYARYAATDWEGAIARFSDALDQTSTEDHTKNRLYAYYLRGNAYFLQGNIPSAIADYDRAIHLDPSYAPAYLNRGVARRRSSDLDGAIQDYDQAIALDPKDPQAYTNRGVAYAELGDYEAAIHDCTRAIELDPNVAQAYYNRGNTHYQQGNLAAAIADYTRAIELDPNYAKAYNNRGNAHADQGNLAAAIADYTRAARLDPNLAQAYYNRGNAHADQGNLAAAIADYTRATELDPNFAQAFNNRGVAHRQRGDLAAAIADYTRAIELDPNYAEAYNNRGNAHTDQGSPAAAIQDFTRAIELDPNLAEAYNNRGNARAEQVYLSGALSDFRRYLALRPNADNREAVEATIAELEAELAGQ